MYVYTRLSKETDDDTRAEPDVAALSGILMAGFHRLNIQAAYNEIDRQ